MFSNSSPTKLLRLYLIKTTKLFLHDQTWISGSDDRHASQFYGRCDVTTGFGLQLSGFSNS